MIIFCFVANLASFMHFYFRDQVRQWWTLFSKKTWHEFVNETTGTLAASQ